jgi:hypothetical protein
MVICGTAVGTASALAGAYYAGRGNRFWTILLQTGLVDEPLGKGHPTAGRVGHLRSWRLPGGPVTAAMGISP